VKIIKSQILNTLAMSYHLHFSIKNILKTRRKWQLISSLVWKVVFTYYKVIYFNNLFKKDILKDQFWNTLKEFKTKISNEERNERIMLQNEKVLAQLKKWIDMPPRTFSKGDRLWLMGHLSHP
jgi:hypothetical protein